MIPVARASRGTLCRMPVISRFLGIVISMYHREHGVPHFHAVYGDQWISVDVKSGAVHGSFLPGRSSTSVSGRSFTVRSC